MAQQVAERLFTDRALASAYLEAKALLIRRGFAPEIDWQYEVRLADISETSFLREAAWVIMSSGLSERAVRSRFPSVSEAFGGFVNAKSIWVARRWHRERALDAFRSAPKIEAILVLIGYVARTGFKHVRESLHGDSVRFLLQFPYLGPATSLHLAKNLGMSVVKPDRHLMRIAARLGYDSVKELCGSVATIVGDPVSVIDLVFWRHAALGGKVGGQDDFRS